MRTVADGMNSPDNQATARRLADDYDRMAERAESRERQNAGTQNSAMQAAAVRGSGRVRPLGLDLKPIEGIQDFCPRQATP